MHDHYNEQPFLKENLRFMIIYYEIYDMLQIKTCNDHIQVIFEAWDIYFIPLSFWNKICINILSMENHYVLHDDETYNLYTYWFWFDNVKL